jgi:polyisoprenoid-binding protein YceI
MTTTTTATTATTQTTQETGLPVGTWQIDPVHSSLEFQVRNMGLVTVKGFFADFEGSLEAGEDGDARAEGTIKAASVHTRSEKRDEHLRAPDFFDVEQYPEIAFRVTAVEPDGDALKVLGELTIKGITRPVELRAEVTGSGPDPWGGERVGIAAYGEVDRRDFDLHWDVRTPTDVPLASHKVKIEAQIGAVKQS